jgi:hypothetical protein
LLILINLIEVESCNLITKSIKYKSYRNGDVFLLGLVSMSFKDLLNFVDSILNDALDFLLDFGCYIGFRDFNLGFFVFGFEEFDKEVVIVISSIVFALRYGSFWTIAMCLNAIGVVDIAVEEFEQNIDDQFALLAFIGAIALAGWLCEKKNQGIRKLLTYFRINELTVVFLTAFA